MSPWVWWPLGAVLVLSIAFAVLIFFVWATEKQIGWLNWATHWVLMALFGAAGLLVLGVWWSLRPGA